MKNIFFSLATIVGVIIVAATACHQQSKENKVTDKLSSSQLIKRGSYLVNAIGCDDCHSPKKMGPTGPQVDLESRLSGHPSNAVLGKADTSVLRNGWVLFSMDLTAFVGPWGTSYSANITPDETGIGSWTEDQFIYCIRNGKYKGMKEGRLLLPPMPWQVYRNLDDTDLKAIFAYLKTIKPVANIVPAPKLPGLP